MPGDDGGDDGPGPDDGGDVPGLFGGGVAAAAGNEYDKYYTKIRKNFELYELLNIPSDQYLAALTKRMLT